jgi:ADP-ribose pyrophosphatase YjhB (NUDIX family)
VSAQMRKLLPEATWCVSESGACGPTFTHDGIAAGFTSICVTGPVTRGIFVESPHADREANMRGFTKHALDLLAECIVDAGKADSTDTQHAVATLPPASTLVANCDRWGGVLMTAVVGATPAAFGSELRRRVAEWKAEAKRGLWLKIPAECTALVGVASEVGFAFHHAKPEYLQMTMWLLDSPSPLPLYSFTQIGVGGVVVNDKGEVLMVKEKTSPSDQYQGSWKLPGGLADPGESFAQTARREVFEETGVESELVGVASLRHSHGVRFGQGDIYVLVRLRATSDTIVRCEREIAEAEVLQRTAEPPPPPHPTVPPTLSTPSFHYTTAATNARACVFACFNVMYIALHIAHRLLFVTSHICPALASG